METNKDQNLSQPALRRSRLGISAFILSLVPILMFCIVFGLYYVMLNGYLGDMSYETGVIVYYLPLCPSITGVIAPLVGVILGVTSLVRKESRKIFAITGIVLGILTALAMCLVTFFIMVMSRT